MVRWGYLGNAKEESFERFRGNESPGKMPNCRPFKL